MRSLGQRIALSVALGQLAVLAVATLLAYRTGARVLTEQFDEGLRLRAAAYEALIEQEGLRVELDGRAALALAPPVGAPRELVQVWGGGYRLYRSPELEGRDLPKPRPGVGAVTFADGTIEGLPVRTLAMRVPVTKVERSLFREAPDEPTVITMVIARERRELDRARAGLLSGLVGGALVLLLSSVLLALWLARRGLAPLREFGHRVGQLDASTLGSSLGPGDHARELQPVVASLEDLLARLDRALRREKRMNATLAHEFRTPIAELSAVTAMALADPGDAEFRGRALEHANRAARRLADLLALIQELVRLERPAGSLETEVVELPALLEELLAPLRAELEGRGLSLAVTGAEGVALTAHRAALASVLANLLGNAAHHAPQGSAIACTVQQEGGRDGASTLVRVANPAGELAREQLEHLTEPFWRGSADRADPERHGLGLAIARGLAELAGLELSFDVRDGTFEAALRVPPPPAQ